MQNQYFKQVKLLLELLPFTLEDQRFALKGGTAINLFFRDMTRLSVDIDLCYLPIETRGQTLANIELGLTAIAERIKIKFPRYTVETKYTKTEEAKHVLVRDGFISVKIEINLVVRGALFPSMDIALCHTAQESFGKKLKARCLHFADVYGGKLCATLDRQHPRDWYDTWVLLEHEGITDNVRKAFLLYLLSCKRPIAEMLDPRPVDRRTLFANELEGMNSSIPAYSVLAEVRTRLTEVLQLGLTSDEREFLLSFKQGKPEWHKSGLANLEEFPAVRWKLFNIQKMSQDKQKTAVSKLKRILKL